MDQLGNDQLQPAVPGARRAWLACLAWLGLGLAWAWLELWLELWLLDVFGSAGQRTVSGGVRQTTPTRLTRLGRS